MRILAAIALCAAMTSCAGTFASGTKVYTQANCSYLEWRGGPNPVLIMRDVDHSTPTRAGGSVIGTAAMGATSIAAAFMSKGVIK